MARRGDGLAAHLIAELASGQSNEDIFERDLAMGHLAHAWVIFVLLDEPSRRIDREQLATIDDRLAGAAGLRLFHRVGRREDAPADVAQPFDPIPQLPASLRVKAGRGLIEEHEWRAVNRRNQQRDTVLLFPRQ